MHEEFVNNPDVSASDSMTAEDSIPIQDEHNGRTTRLRSDLVKAIGYNQFCLHYQPMVDLNTNEIFAAEAFIRWEHPTFGTLLPNEFLSIAEKSDFIIEMGDWVLNEVLQNYSEWLKQGLQPIKIAVNHSSAQFLQEDFVKNIIETTRRHDLKPDFLIIEIQERVPIGNDSLVKSNIDKLHDLGILVALDNFGTGYSSLTYLSRLDIDILKISRVFTQTIPDDKTNEMIIETILSLSQRLGLKTVAEGIEAPEQLEFLTAINCPAGQGYLLSKPMPHKDFMEMFKNKTLKLDSTRQADDTNSERRKYDRHRFPLCLEASMTILKYHGQEVYLGSTLVLIRDVGGGGLCFYTTLRIPVKSDILIQFTTTLLDKQIVFHGTPVWGKEVKENLFKYGIEFKINEEKRKPLISLIQQISEDNEALTGDFVRQSPSSYFQIE